MKKRNETEAKHNGRLRMAHRGSHNKFHPLICHISLLSIMLLIFSLNKFVSLLGSLNPASSLMHVSHHNQFLVFIFGLKFNRTCNCMTAFSRHKFRKLQIAWIKHDYNGEQAVQAEGRQARNVLGCGDCTASFSSVPVFSSDRCGNRIYLNENQPLILLQ